MNPEEINSLGLVLNILGVVLLFFFGFPQPSHDEGVSLGLSGNTTFTDGSSVASIKAAAKRRKCFYKFFSYFALVLLFTGFVLQLWATWA
ncbi:MAG: hypothetical protein P8X74_20305 [Reinekea sp.]